MTEEEKAYAHWLYQSVGMGSRVFLRSLARFGTARELHALVCSGALAEKVSERYRKKVTQMSEFTAGYDVEEEYRRMTQRGIRLVTEGEAGFPGRLAGIPDAPFALYYVGVLPSEEKKAVALIGARDCTEYGRYMAEQFGRVLAAAGVQVVSGMARGIDGIGQKSALGEGGYSLGVLGCGVDICYPGENRELYDALANGGGICSEYPPGTAPRAVLFPPRNRIISGFCDALLVIEAKERSGTLITVDMALEQGREVYALPGRATDPLSSGCNRLIRQGAGLVASPEELLEELHCGAGLCAAGGTGTGTVGSAGAGTVSSSGTGTDATCSAGAAGGTGAGTVSGAGMTGAPWVQTGLVFLDGVSGELYHLLDIHPLPAEELQRRYEEKYGSSIALPRLFKELLDLCAAGYARQVGGSYFMRVMK